jgi:hypothetical protein
LILDIDLVVPVRDHHKNSVKIRGEPIEKLSAFLDRLTGFGFYAPPVASNVRASLSMASRGAEAAGHRDIASMWRSLRTIFNSEARRHGISVSTARSYESRVRSLVRLYHEVGNLNDGQLAAWVAARQSARGVDQATNKGRMFDTTTIAYPLGDRLVELKVPDDLSDPEKALVAGWLAGIAAAMGIDAFRKTGE